MRADSTALATCPGLKRGVSISPKLANLFDRMLTRIATERRKVSKAKSFGTWERSGDQTTHSTQTDRGDLLAVVESKVGSGSHFVFVSGGSG